MTDAQIRELILEMLGRTRGGTRQEMDAAKCRRLQGFKLLHKRFIDKEVVVRIPEQWDYPMTASKIDSKIGPGLFEE
jgi:hypothetical protein